MHQKTRMDFKTANAFASDEFEKRHPRETWPEWVIPCTVVSYSSDENKRIIVSYSVSFKETLGEHEHWEEINGTRYLVEVDPKTSKELVVLRTPRRTETYFRAAVDPETAGVTVLIDLELSRFVGEDLNY